MADTVNCPICRRQVSGDECFDISMFAEGSTPNRFHAADVDPEKLKEKAEICLQCEYHPS